MLMFFLMDKERTFLPAGVMISAGILVISGLALGVIGTPFVALNGDISLSLRTGQTLFKTSHLQANYMALLLKGIIGLAMVISGVGLASCKESSRSMAVNLLAIVGLVMPLFIKISMTKIDFEFIYVFQFISFVISTSTIFYLTRPSTVSCIDSGGVPAWRVSSYCPICEIITQNEKTVHCSDCDNPLLNLYETEQGQIFALPIEDNSKE
jgi:hypothetical protein